MFNTHPLGTQLKSLLHIVALVLWLLAYSSPVQAQSNTTELEGTYANLHTSGGTVFRIAPDTSTIRIYAFRGGKAPKLGHNHVLSAPNFEGYFHVPAEGALNTRFDLSFRLDQLVLDQPEHRAALGANFASTLSEEAVEGTRRNLLGDKLFQAETYPYVRIRSVHISGDAPKFAARIVVEMHGQTREQWVALSVQGLPDALQAEGAFVLRQTDFGVQPFSLLGGLLAVQDEVVVEFSLQGRKAAVPTDKP